MHFGEMLFCMFDRRKGSREPHLMSAANQVQVVAPQKLRDNVLAERERHTTIALRPSPDVGIGICPQDIAQEARVGDIRGAQDTPNLLHAV